VRNKFDGKVLSKTIIKCFVSLLSATNEKNENIYFIDVNNNYDFSDDVPLHPADSRKSDKDLNQHLVSVMCQRILNGEIISERVPLLIVKKGNSLLYSIAQYATGSFSTRKKNYELAVCPLYFYGRTWKQTQILLLNDSLKSKKVRKDLIVNTDGFITIGNSIYKFNGVDISKNTLILKKVSNNNEYSSQVGFHAPLFKSKDILTGTNVSLASYKGKYILIDFWGTWCHPCREQLPTLVKLNNSVDSSRFVLISIATMDSVANLKKVISQENMTWPQLFSDQITRQYNVSAFPTSLLIDPNGIVIARDLSMEDLMQRLSKLALLN
jgi:thiol-disulfide isomerase/thioredoxin